ncbi:MAG TPA: iron ABC transporter permease [Alphaproteobacteria bacterium]
MTAPAPWGLYLAGAVLLVAAAAGSVLVGPGGGLFALWRDDPDLASLIAFEIRLPRLALALVTGATLGLSGAALQGLLRNPLAEPGLIGASSSAALGAVLVLYFGLSAAVPMALPLAGMAGALVSVVLLAALVGGEASTLTLILAGIAINSFATALTALALNLAPNPYAVYEIVFWLLGSVADRDLDQLALIAGPVALGWLLLLGAGRGLDALSLGEEVAQSLGVRTGRLFAQVVVGTALAVGAVVSVTGVIGFVGLVVPHLVRPLLGHQPGRLLPASALAGAILLVVADIAVRLAAPAGGELRLGVVTALVGAPFFLWLLLETRRRML